MIRIKVEHCNNVKNADLTLHPDALNLLYAMNGTGKSTIAKAIKSAAGGGMSVHCNRSELQEFRIAQ